MELALFILFLGICMGGVVACVLRPPLALAAFISMYAVEQILQSYQPVLIFQYAWAVNAAVFAICFFAIGNAFLRGQDVWTGYLNRVGVLLTLLVAWMLLSILWSPVPEAALHFLDISWPYFVMQMVVVPMLVRRTEDLDVNFRAMMLLGVLIAVFIFISPRANIVGGRLGVDLGYVAGLGDFRTNPLALADFGAGQAIIAALYRAKEKSKFWLAVQTLAFVSGLVVALASGSRGQVLGAVACSALLFPLAAHRRSLGQFFSVAIFGAFAAGTLFAIYNIVFGAGGQSRWSATEVQGGFADRFGMALISAEAYLNSPAFWLQGLGASAFNSFFFNRDIGFWYPHNVVIEAFVEYGLVGISMFGLALLFTALAGVRWIRIFDLDQHQRSLGVVWIGLTLFTFLMSLKQGALLNAPMLFTFMWIAAKLVHAEERDVARGVAPDLQDHSAGEIEYDHAAAEAYGTASFDQTPPTRAG
jgi:hypothetical protein